MLLHPCPSLCGKKGNVPCFTRSTQEQHRVCSIYVGNLGREVCHPCMFLRFLFHFLLLEGRVGGQINEGDIVNVFSQFGPIVNVNINLDSAQQGRLSFSWEVIL